MIDVRVRLELDGPDLDAAWAHVEKAVRDALEGTTIHVLDTPYVIDVVVDVERVEH